MIAIAAEHKHQIENKLITEFESPELVMNTEYGNVNFLEWLELERERLKNKNVTTAIYCNGGGRVALVRK